MEENTDHEMYLTYTEAPPTFRFAYVKERIFLPDGTASDELRYWRVSYGRFGSRIHRVFTPLCKVVCWFLKGLSYLAKGELWQRRK